MFDSPTIVRRGLLLCAVIVPTLAIAAPEASAQQRGPRAQAAEILQSFADDLRDAGARAESRGRGQGQGQGHGHGRGHGGNAGDGFYPGDAAREHLGKLLFWDKILSGNQSISCATCHHGLAATGDGLSLPVGQGGIGLGVTRSAASITERVPRNAPHVFNLGAVEFTRMFHDGRVELLPDDSFRSPAGAALPAGLDNVLAVQAMFPVTSGTEMAGHAGDNPIANAAAAGDLPQVWALLADRLRAIPEYVGLFADAFDDVNGAADITYVHAANAIAAYEAAAFRADDSPYDRYLAGDHGALSKNQRKGLKVFEQAGGCVQCHSGRFQTNHEFFAIAMPQIGPGKGDNQPGYADGLDDFGRERVTGDPADRFRFRVPTLRNVVITGPWGHDGAYDTLEAMVRHHLNPVARLNDYDTAQAVLPANPALPDDLACHQDSARRAGIAAGNELAPRSLGDDQIADLMEFLHALTDRASLDLRHTIPMEVPSGLPVLD